MTFAKSALLLVAVVGCCNAFQPSAINRVVSTTGSTSRSRLQVHPELLSGGVAGGLDPQELSTHVHAVQGYLQQHLEHSNLLLSDASAATLDSASASSSGNPLDAIQSMEEPEEGWWNAYLNIFKMTIKAIHSTIDEPIHKYTGWQGGTYGFAIAIFTAGIRSLLIPLSVQQSKSTEYNKALQPYIVEINEKFKDNEQRKNQAVGKLYEDANQNPLSGCLLSLFQLPIFLGLYRGVRLLALDGVLDEKFLWIPSLQGPVTAETDFRGMDWITQGWTQNIDSGMWTPSLGWETTLAFCVMPVLLVLGQKLTMTALSPPDLDDGRDDVDEASMSKEEKEAKDQADTTKNVLKFLPLLIGFFSLQVPAALTIYWFTSNGFTLAQSLAVRKYYESNPPVIELPDYWDDLSDDENEMTSEKRRAAAKAGISKGPSLDDWVLNCKFHTVVERQPLRENSNAWLQIEGYNSTKKLVIPAEFQTWVSSSVTKEVNGVNGSGSADTTEEEEASVPQAASS